MTPDSIPKEEYSILIELDMILDTRLAILADMNFDWVEKHLDEGYRNRLSDHWTDIDDGIDVEKYNQIYENRDRFVMSRAKITGMIALLVDMLDEYENEILYGKSPLQKVNLVVNTYPYQLTVLEERQLLQCLTEYLGTIITVRLISLSIEETGIKNLKHLGFDQYIMYDFNRWVVHHYNTKTNYHAMERDQGFIIVTPRLRYKGIDPEFEEQLRERNLHKVDQFGVTSDVFATLFKLIWIPVTFACIIDGEQIKIVSQKMQEEAEAKQREEDSIQEEG